MLLTVDIVFLDEAGKISAEMMAALNIGLRNLRESQDVTSLGTTVAEFSLSDIGVSANDTVAKCMRK